MSEDAPLKVEAVGEVDWVTLDRPDRLNALNQPLADALLDKAGVASLSGTAFGEYGEGYLRFSMANSYEHLMEAVERIARFME